MKKISILGVTGSIGMQTVDVVVSHPDLFEVIGVSAGRNIEKLKEVIETIHPCYVSVIEEEDALTLQKEYPNIEIYYGKEGLVKIATLEQVNVVLNAVVGFAGLVPTIEAIKLKKDIALANKETLVVAGHIITKLAKENGVALLPVDSEHSAIFQCLNGEDHGAVDRLLITASGGSFRDKSRDELVGVTKQQALNHPNWSMGAKITIDSATMFNKGFEVIEAHWLFNVDYDHIHVYIHPESIIHSMVEFEDTAVMAQLGTPDMRLPIQYALTYPKRIEIHGSQKLDLAKIASLHFKEPDFNRYPALKMAYDAGKKGGSYPCVLNGANEQAVSLFLNDQIEFLQIETCVEHALRDHEWVDDPSLEQLLEIDKWARQHVLDEVGGLSCKKS